MSGVCEKTESLLAEDIRYDDLIQRGQLLRAWKMFSRGKLRQPAVRRFWLNLENKLAELYHNLVQNKYIHGKYAHFVLNETKRRDIYVAGVRDRVIHQLVSSYLEELYQKHFIAHSYASQTGKGLSAARHYAFKAIRRGRNPIWIAKMDVQKYFANVGHDILLSLLARRVGDLRILNLCKTIIESFEPSGRGLPLGNLTSQWFANIYLHELDWYAKQTLRVQYYMRYNDDIIVVGENEKCVRSWVDKIVSLAQLYLKLTIPPYKVQVVSLPGGWIDILGICTDGRRRWTRQTTVRRAKVLLTQKYEQQSFELLDALCSYAGAGIEHGLALFPAGVYN